MTAPRAPRRTRRLAPVLVALIVGGVAVTIVVDIVAVAAQDHTLVWPAARLAHDLRTRTWSCGAVMAVGIVAGVVGLILLLQAVLPGRRRLLPVEADDPNETAGVSLRSLVRALRGEAESVSGVDTASVRMRRRNRRAEIRIRTAFRDAGDVPGQVDQAVGRGLDALRLARRPDVRATLGTRSDADAAS